MAINKSKVGEAFVSMELDRSPLVRGLKMAHRQVASFGGKLSSGGGALMGMGGAMMGTAAGLAAPFVGAMGAGMKFQSMMSQVKAVTGATGEGFESLEAKAKELGSTTSFSATQVAEAMKFLGMAGFSDAQILASVGDVLNLAKAGGLELGEAADIASDVGSAFGLTADELGRVSDVIAKTATSANTSVEMMGETFKKAAPIAKAAGQSLEEVSAAIGLLGNSGVKSSIAGTDISNIMASIADPKKRAIIEKFAGSVVDANGEMKPMVDILQAMGQGMESLTGPERLAAMMEAFGRESAKGALILAQSTTESVESMRAAIASTTVTAASMAAVMGDNTTGAFAGLTSAIEGVSIEIHDALAPAFRYVVGLLTSAAQSIRQFIAENGQLVLAIVASIAALASFGAGLTIAGAALAAIGISISGAVTMFGLLTSPIALATAGVLAIGAAMLSMVVSADEAAAGVKSRMLAIVDFIKPVADGIADAFSAQRWDLAGQIAVEALKVALIKGMEELVELAAEYGKRIAKALLPKVGDIASFFNNPGAYVAGMAGKQVATGDAIPGSGVASDLAMAEYRLAKLLEEAEQARTASEQAKQETDARKQRADDIWSELEALDNEMKAGEAAAVAVPPLDVAKYAEQIANINLPNLSESISTSAIAGMSGDAATEHLAAISEAARRLVEIEETREPLIFGSGT